MLAANVVQRAPQSSVRLSLVVVLGLAAVWVAGCSTAPFKEDIAKFKNGVDKATLAFDTLGKQAQARTEHRKLRRYALTTRPPIFVGAGCNEFSGQPEGQIQADVFCLWSWAMYRSEPEESRGDPPSCSGAREKIKNGENVFYDFEALRKQESEACRLGVVSSGALNDKAFVTDPLLAETPQLSSGLRAYASALADIADASDREALAGSVAKAQDSLVKLVTNIETENRAKIRNAPVVGPVTAMAGSILGAALERRRLRALQDVTAAADPVVGLSAVLLANSTVSMTNTEIGIAKDAFLTTLQPALVVKEPAQWMSLYETNNAARKKYLEVYSASPISALQAMAKAHTTLKEELGKKEKQYAVVASAIEDFAEKAQALQDALDKQEEERKKAKKDAEG